MAIGPEELLEHTNFIRAMASSLIPDQHLADDITQQTWIAALQRPPESEKSLRNWLSRVIRNFAFQTIRGEGRREQRKKALVRKEVIPSTEDIVEREEMREIIINAILSLKEPYKSIILLRFFEDLPPRRIAKTLKEPLETVKTRLKRGLDQLRKKLDDEYGGNRRAWILQLAACAGFSLAARTTSASISTSTVITKLASNTVVKIGVSVALFLAVTVATWRLTNISKKPVPAYDYNYEQKSVLLDTSASRPRKQSNAASPAKSTELSKDKKSTFWIEDELNPISLYGIVIDSERRELEANVELINENGTSRTVRAKKEFGYWFTGLPPGNWQLCCKKKGYREFKKHIALGPDKAIFCQDIELMSKVTLKIKALTPEGEPLIESLERRGIYTGEKTVFGAVATLKPPSGHFPPCSLRTLSRFGVGEFHCAPRSSINIDDPCIGFLELDEPPPVYVSVVLRHAILATEYVRKLTGEVTVTVLHETVIDNLARVRLSVGDKETGQPITNGTVSLKDRQEFGSEKKLDDNGNVVFENCAPGLLLLTVNATDYETVCNYVLLKPGQDLDLGTLALSKETTISGFIFAEDGRYLNDLEDSGSNCFIAYRNLDRMTFPQPVNNGRRVLCDSYGYFQIQKVGRGHCLLLVNKEGFAILAKQIDTLNGPEENISLVLQSGTNIVLKPEIEIDRYYVLSVINEAGTMVWCENLADLEAIKLTLAPGKYYWKLNDDEGLNKIESFRVGKEPLSVYIR